MNICFNTKHISKLSWLLNCFSLSHLRVHVDEAKGNSPVWRTVINLRLPCRVPLRLSCYGSQIRGVLVSTRPQEDPGIKFSWSLSLPQPSRTIRNTPRRFFFLSPSLCWHVLCSEFQTQNLFLWKSVLLNIKCRVVLIGNHNWKTDSC